MQSEENDWTTLKVSIPKNKITDHFEKIPGEPSTNVPDIETNTKTIVHQ